jgi:hypothetical protein
VATTIKQGQAEGLAVLIPPDLKFKSGTADAVG